MPFSAVPIEMRRRYKTGPRKKNFLIGGAAVAMFSVTFMAGMAITNWSKPSVDDTDSADTTIAAFAALPQIVVCADGPRTTCVVDGDTFWLNGEKIRIADIDTPEMDGRCAFESRQARAARDRLVALLNAGPFNLQPIGSRDRDQYGRLLRAVERNGRSLGDQLVAEGLARTWSGKREPWC